MSEAYEDIINLPHHVSVKHTQMSAIERAAQFSPFAALSGYDAAMRETARQTTQRIELDDYVKAIINDRLRQVEKHLSEAHVYSITYFVPDGRKAGGSYKTIESSVKKIDEDLRLIILQGGQKIPIDEVVEVMTNDKV